VRRAIAASLPLSWTNRGSGLNVREAEIRALVRDSNRDEVTVLLTSHDAGDIEHRGERVLPIDQGVTVCHDACSTPLLAQPAHRHPARAALRSFSRSSQSTDFASIDSLRHAVAPLWAAHLA
jgi:ABC-type uncharacterized transport system ATPase subunit